VSALPGIPDQQGGRVDVGSPIWLFIPVSVPPEPPFVCACGKEYRIGCQWESLHQDGKGSSGQRCCSRGCAGRLLAEYCQWRRLREGMTSHRFLTDP